MIPISLSSKVDEVSYLNDISLTVKDGDKELVGKDALFEVVVNGIYE